MYNKLRSFLKISLIYFGGISLNLFAETNDTASKFWSSVYEENHIVQIHINARREAWKSMQPSRVERKPGGPRVHFGNKFSYAKADITIDGKLFKNDSMLESFHSSILTPDKAP